jgi:hypothetical protein
MWIYAVIVEHSVMLSRVCILVFFPVYPEWIGDAKDVLRFRVGEMKKLSRARREQELVRCHATPPLPHPTPTARVQPAAGSGRAAWARLSFGRLMISELTAHSFCVRSVCAR